MTYPFTAAQSLKELATLILQVKHGDVISVTSETRAKLARRALKRMGVSGVNVEVWELKP